MTTKLNRADVEISKTLSWILRHTAEDLKLPIDSAGYVEVYSLLKLEEMKGVNFNKLKNIVNNNNKQRYELKEENNKWFIRATQGHTMKIINSDELLERILDPDTLKDKQIVHGTNMDLFEIIFQTGLSPMKRNHVHFAEGFPEDNVISGMRNSCNLFIELNVPLALKNGMKIYRSSNGVILTEGLNRLICPAFFKKVMYLNNKREREVLYETSYESRMAYCYKYLLVLDFEANCLENEKITPQEIVEFPVIPICTQNNNETIKNFRYFIKPEIKELTPFCTQLTGITKEQVNSGISLKEALNKFKQYLIDNSLNDEDVCFITCGDWDLKTCLKNECEYKKIFVDPIFNKFFNIKEIFSSVMNIPNVKGMPVMLNILKKPLIGKHHSGIDDCQNIATILKYLLHEKEFLPLKRLSKKIVY